MSVSGISSTSLFAGTDQNVVSKHQQQVQQDFQQLGQDLQSGNLTAAQSDFTSLQQLVPQLGSNSQTSSSDPRVQAFNQLEKDIQSGNVSGAQQDYSNIQQMFQNRSEHFHHHHHVSTDSSGNGEVSQLFQQLGQALQSGNLTAAQTAYSTIQQDLAQFGMNLTSTAQATTSTVNVTG